MRRRLVGLATGLLLASLPTLRAAAEDPPARDGADVLAGVLGALPDLPLRITADLQSRGTDGGPETKLGVDMLLDWQDSPPTARYTLRDAFGATRSHLAITWHPGRPPEYRFFTGTPLQAAPLPDLVAPIEGTDISWMDLSLSFLWWPDAVLSGREDVKGRDCLVVDTAAPPGSFAGCAGVRLWIDPRIHILLRAEAYDAANAPMRRLEVKSFKKINDRWVIKDIELTSLPSKHKTHLRVRDVQDRMRKDYIARDEGGPDAPAEAVEPETGVDDGLAPPETDPGIESAPLPGGP